MKKLFLLLTLVTPAVLGASYACPNQVICDAYGVCHPSNTTGLPYYHFTIVGTVPNIAVTYNLYNVNVDTTRHLGFCWYRSDEGYGHSHYKGEYLYFNKKKGIGTWVNPGPGVNIDYCMQQFMPPAVCQMEDYP